MLTRSLLGSVVVVSVVLVACSSDSTEQTLSFKDSKGHSCTTTRGGVTATCDQAPAPSAACAAGTSACWVVSSSLDQNDQGQTVSSATVITNCAQCCQDGGRSSTGVAKDCAQVTCTTPADCLGYNNASCVKGRCVL